jgi:hypothetical protein
MLRKLLKNMLLNIYFRDCRFGKVFTLKHATLHLKYTTMFELSKYILQQYSFDETLFGKELRKILLWMGEEKSEEKMKLREWCETNFGKIYGKTIRRTFKSDKVLA